MLKSKAAGVCAMLALAGCATGPAEPMMSWGKPGVSYADYRTDSIECAYFGATGDIAGTSEFADIERGIREQNRTIDRGNGDIYDQVRDYNMVYQRAIRSNVDTLQDLMVARVQQCLTGRGYREFALTPAEEEQLGRLKRGTDERFRYLHQLASTG